MPVRILILIVLTALLALSPARAAEPAYARDSTYLALREAVHNTFNQGDSASFFPALQKLQDYLLAQDDLHAYYTQRCNEIVFLMNRQNIVEAYKRARQLSIELTERKLDKEMYMAYNMLGHINRYCGNKEEAKRNFYHVIDLMEQAGYYESMPPIYMNIVGVSIEDSPEEALQLLDKAKAIAEKYAPQRVFDIETRKTLSYYNSGDVSSFLEGYKRYREGVAEGKTSVHGRSMEIYHLAVLGKTDEAVALARREMGDEGGEAIPLIYERAGRWREAYDALKRAAAANDSIDNVVITNSMAGIRDQLLLYEAQQEAVHMELVALGVGIATLTLLVIALFYVATTRRKNLRLVEKAYQKALETDKMKTAFLQNVSHEVRTPLNIINGFAQVIADPDLTESVDERRHIASLMQKNCDRVTTLIDEALELSANETTDAPALDKDVPLVPLLRDLLSDSEAKAAEGVALRFESTLSDDFTVTTNKLMLRRALNILLDNAVKHTAQGHITLKASVSGTNLTLAVEDSGSGIPAAQAEHIFERFFKIDDFEEGFGLGLPLCRKLIERLSGTVVLDTAYAGPGARFVVTLPV